MTRFSLGIIIGSAVSTGIILALHPLDKRFKRRMCRKAHKIANKINCTMHNMI